MKKNEKFPSVYVKYIIKNPVLFYSYLILCLGLFLSLSLTLKLDTTTAVSADIIGDSIMINGEYPGISDEIYVFKDRNDRILKCKITDTIINGSTTVIKTEELIEFQGSSFAEIKTGEETLFRRIFINAGKG